MPSVRQPRSGSMGYWPRKRAAKQTPRVRSWGNFSDAKPLGFAGYKAGMTHVMITDNRKNSTTKGSKVRMPVTVIECPDLKIIGVRFYKKGFFGNKVAEEIEFKSDNKRLYLKKNISKKPKGSLEGIKALDEYSDIRLLVHTIPGETKIGKKTPDVFELGIGGSLEDKFNYAKENAGKSISFKDVFVPGEQVDAKAVTTGKGLQGSVKRFGIHVRAKKSEKTKRAPGSISGGWTSQGHMMYRVPQAGQMGYHTRTEHNKVVMGIIDNPDDVNPSSGFVGYGFVKNPCMLIKGSLPGPKKRLIRLNKAIRPNSLYNGFTPAIDLISKESQQR